MSLTLLDTRTSATGRSPVICKYGLMQMELMSLNKGDKIGIISPAGAVAEPEKLEEACGLFGRFGYEVKVYEGCYKNFRAMAGTDEERLKDLHDAFSDDSIKAVICARGGYGALRIIDRIDYDLISQNAKIFAGSSDITALLVNIYKRTGMRVFHSPMALNGFDTDIFEDFLAVVNGEKKEICAREDFKTLREGEAKGILWGGNLATLVSLFGCDPDTYVPQEDIILFLEDLNEPNYKIDRMLRQIYRNDALKKRIKGIIFGDFLDSGNPLELEEISKEYAELFAVPASRGYPITHLKPNAVLPLGQLVDFKNSYRKTLFL